MTDSDQGKLWGEILRVVFGGSSGLLSIWKDVYSRSLWLTWGLTSFVVAIAGPFGTFATRPFPWRLGYWGGVIAVAILFAISFRAIWRTALSGRPSLKEDIFVSIGLSLVFGPFIVGLNRYLAGPNVENSMGYLTAMGYILAIAACTIAVRRFMKEPSNTLPDHAARDRLLDRISVENGARLARISSDNHHIRIVTNDGAEHRVLMRLRDAVAEVDVEHGLCVHRSHWVAEAQIDCVEVVAGREIVKLRCGTIVPVGPKYRDNLIAAGVITD